ncbi:uncharacterized protein LOC141907046 [Tubulanus polymorphus]|uniref:uncharacterized protein LOC141907046 n=1 Tax=Tubulanus polymorphus TaxID=672921 RepID=UPI003DA48083
MADVRILITDIVCWCGWIVIISLPAADGGVCTAYCSEYDIWHEDEHCSKYCCGDIQLKYCCSRYANQISAHDNRRGHVNSNCGARGGAYMLPIILSAVFSIFLIISVIICIFCCRYRRGRSTQRGAGGAVMYTAAGPVQPTVYGPPPTTTVTGYPTAAYPQQPQQYTADDYPFGQGTQYNAPYPPASAPPAPTDYTAPPPSYDSVVR